jgi:Papain family cysteine protease
MNANNSKYADNNLNEYNPTINKVDLSNDFTEVYDQGRLGSCVVNSFCAVFNYHLIKGLGLEQNKKMVKLANCFSFFFLGGCINKNSTIDSLPVIDKDLNDKFNYIKPFRPSRYYLYYYACKRNQSNISTDKILDNFVDGGGVDGINRIIKVINEHGILAELKDESNNDWQLNANLDNPTEKNDNFKDEIDKLNKQLDGLNKNPDKNPDKNQIEIADTEELIAKYQNFKFKYDDIYFTNDSDEIIEAKKWINCISQINIFPKVAESTSPTSIIKKYLQNSIPVLIGMKFDQSNAFDQLFIIKAPDDASKINGSHMMVIVGYDDSMKAFKIRNSWSAGWGYGGYGYLSYNFFENEKNEKVDLTKSGIHSLDYIKIKFDSYPKPVQIPDQKKA